MITSLLSRTRAVGLGFAGDLMPGQAEVVEWLATRPRAVFTDDVAPDKAVVFALIDRLAANGHIELPESPEPGSSGLRRLCRVLWLTSEPLVHQTAAEAAERLPGASVLSGADPEMTARSTGRYSPLQKRVAVGVDLLVISHEMAHNRRRWLDRHTWAMVVIDEAMAIKMHGPLTQTMRELTKRSPRVLSIAAMPPQIQPQELWTLASITDVPGLPPWTTFQTRFTDPGDVKKIGRDPAPECVDSRHQDPPVPESDRTTSTVPAPAPRLRFEGDLRPHQSEAVAWLMERPKAVLADDVGLGKTPTVLALIGDLAEAGQLDPSSQEGLCRVLWITEAGLINQTVTEIRRFLPDASVMSSLDPEMRSSARAAEMLVQRMRSGIDVLVLSYEKAHTYHGLDRHLPSIVVMDEASKIKSGGKIADSLRELTARVPRVVAMTATPLENNPLESWHLLSVTGTPSLWPRREFEQRFVTFREVSRGPEITKRVPHDWQPGAAEIVGRYVYEHVLRRTAEEAGLRLPELRTEHRWVPLTAEQQAAYEAAEKRGDLAGFWRQSRAGLAHGENSPLVAELVAELNRRGDGQAIVYCENLAMLDLVEAALREAGISLVRIEGKISDKQRAERAEAFRLGKVRVLLGSRVLERGLNLQHCPLLISLDASWNPAREDQRAGRIRRIGSPFTEVEHIVLLPDTPLVKAKVGTLDRKLSAREAVGL